MFAASVSYTHLIQHRVDSEYITWIDISPRPTDTCTPVSYTHLSPKTDIANPNFDMQNLNKRFLSINTRTVDGKQALMKLLETADVFLTNYRVQALEKMGLTYDQLKGTYPKLIHASVLGYGEKGPEKDRPGYDYTAFCARTGLLADMAPAGDPPMMTVAGLGDHSVAVALSGAIEMCIRDRFMS